MRAQKDQHYTVVVQGYPEIKNALTEFADNPIKVPKVRSESNGLYERMCLLETRIYSEFWNDIGPTRESKRD